MKRGQLWKKRICSIREQIVSFLEWTPFQNGLDMQECEQVTEIDPIVNKTTWSVPVSSVDQNRYLQTV